MFLGIDIGTSGVKAIVMSGDGRVRGQGSAVLRLSRPAPLWSEQAPSEWWSATDAAVRSIDPDLRRQVSAVGLAGQMHGATVLGADDVPLRPAILWNDGRSAEQCRWLEAEVGNLHALTGNLAMPGFTAPKLLWLRQHEPRLFDAVRMVLLPKDYVRLVMTGDKASDVSDSAGTLWLDVGRRQWSDTILEACGLSRAQMPTLHEGNEFTGALRPEIAEAWGMDCAPVAAGGGDNAAAAAGVGVVKDGDALLSLGTSGVIFVATDTFRANPGRAVHAFCHCLPGQWHQMSVHLSAAACVDWAARLVGADSPAALFAIAERAGPASGPEIFLPYLSGERTPHNDPSLRGGFLGLDHDTDPGRLAKAVLEGVAFALADGLDALREAGTRVESLRVVGGGARSDYWGRVIAAALDTPLTYLNGGEVGPAMGAARLAQAAFTGQSPFEICTSPPVRSQVIPDPELVQRLAPKRAAFKAALPAAHFSSHSL